MAQIVGRNNDVRHEWQQALQGMGGGRGEGYLFSEEVHQELPILLGSVPVMVVPLLLPGHFSVLGQLCHFLILLSISSFRQSDAHRSMFGNGISERAVGHQHCTDRVNSFVNKCICGICASADEPIVAIAPC